MADFHAKSRSRATPFATFLACAILLTACTERVTFPINFSPVPPPVPIGNALKLTVAHVVNPRFERFTPAQVDALLAALKISAKTHFGQDIDFAPVETFAIDQYFVAIPANHFRWRSNWYLVDSKNGKIDRTRFSDAYDQVLKTQTAAPRDWAAFAAKEIGLEKVDTDPYTWKNRLADTHLERLARLAGMRGQDGLPVIDATPRNEWLYWATIGEREPGFDITLTNQLVASAEYSTADIHVALRGGMSLGTADYANHTKLNAQFWWSTFAFTSDDPLIVSMRGGERYEPMEAALLAGTLAAHELGHMLYRYGHPFNVPACVMSPVPMLRFRETAGKLDAARCAVANDPAMKYGGMTIMRPLGLK